ncbi:hypothetical protein QTA57_00220 [Fontisubflavum oceani]|uniref:hypothetical protein n=1 Tax=Fontisubflavum oceani TaxID=2978973 RepID=UPI0025B319BD|nr:hypothetical protein [Fontisubflavum oceani]WJY21675.1 hypothetical protein QTA57_00220 [Fontisubflavum oceani]
MQHPENDRTILAFQNGAIDVLPGVIGLYAARPNLSVPAMWREPAAADIRILDRKHPSEKMG